MKTVLKISILPALLLALASVAYADSITLNSAGGTSNFTNGTLQYLGTSPLNSSFVANNYSPLVAPATPTTASGSSSSYNIPSGGWYTAITGTSWVANTATTDTTCTNGATCDPNDFYYYQTTFTATGGSLLYNGSITVMADDTLEVLLNGNVIVNFGIVGGDGHCGDNAPSCGSATTFLLNNITLLPGVNTLTLIDAQTGLNGAGVDMSANLTQAPEPTSLLMLGTGLLGLAFVLFRKNKPTGVVVNS